MKLDWIGQCPPNLWRKQEEVFRKVLSLVRQEKSLDTSSPTSWSRQNRYGCACPLHADITQILWLYSTNPCPLFYGRCRTCQRMETNYSNVYFGFTGAVDNFSTDQIAGLQSVPMNRILLETDSPYMRPGGGGINTPAFIGDVASIVASKLRIPVQHLLKSTVQNKRQLYGC